MISEYRDLIKKRDHKRKYHREYNKRARKDGRIPNWRDIIKLKSVGIDTSGLNKIKAQRLVRRFFK